VLIRTEQRKDCVFWIFEDGVFEVSVRLQQGEVVGNLTLSHILEPELIEVGGVVVHF
jgi:hypothetical protein